MGDCVFHSVCFSQIKHKSNSKINISLEPTQESISWRHRWCSENRFRRHFFHPRDSNKGVVGFEASISSSCGSSDSRSKHFCWKKKYFGGKRVLFSWGRWLWVNERVWTHLSIAQQVWTCCCLAFWVGNLSAGETQFKVYVKDYWALILEVCFLFGEKVVKKDFFSYVPKTNNLVDYTFSKSYKLTENIVIFLVSDHYTPYSLILDEWSLFQPCQCLTTVHSHLFLKNMHELAENVAQDVNEMLITSPSFPRPSI